MRLSGRHKLDLLAIGSVRWVHASPSSFDHVATGIGLYLLQSPHHRILLGLFAEPDSRKSSKRKVKSKASYQ